MLLHSKWDHFIWFYLTRLLETCIIMLGLNQIKNCFYFAPFHTYINFSSYGVLKIGRFFYRASLICHQSKWNHLKMILPHRLVICKQYKISFILHAVTLLSIFLLCLIGSNDWFIHFPLFDLVEICSPDTNRIYLNYDWNK